MIKICNLMNLKAPPELLLDYNYSLLFLFRMLFSLYELLIFCLLITLDVQENLSSLRIIITKTAKVQIQWLAKRLHYLSHIKQCNFMGI